MRTSLPRSVQKMLRSAPSDVVSLKAIDAGLEPGLLLPPITAPDDEQQQQQRKAAAPAAGGVPAGVRLGTRTELLGTSGRRCPRRALAGGSGEPAAWSQARRKRSAAQASERRDEAPPTAAAAQQNKCAVLLPPPSMK